MQIQQVFSFKKKQCPCVVLKQGKGFQSQYTQLFNVLKNFENSDNAHAL